MSKSINIPILIVAKGVDQHLFELSYCLLPFAYDYVYKQQLLEQTWVISDDNRIIDWAKKLGFINVYKEHCKHCPICHISYNGAYHCIIDNNLDCEWFINFRLDQPFKSFRLILDLITNIDNRYDMICTATYITDRSMYFIDENDKFINNVENRLVEYCPKVKMIDSAAYAHKTKIFKQAVESGHFDKESWKYKFKTVINDVPYFAVLDTDTISHLDKCEQIFLDVKDHMNEIESDE